MKAPVDDQKLGAFIEHWIVATLTRKRVLKEVQDEVREVGGALLKEAVLKGACSIEDLHLDLRALHRELLHLRSTGGAQAVLDYVESLDDGNRVSMRDMNENRTGTFEPSDLLSAEWNRVQGSAYCCYRIFGNPILVREAFAERELPVVHTRNTFGFLLLRRAPFTSDQIDRARRVLTCAMEIENSASGTAKLGISRKRRPKKGVKAGCASGLIDQVVASTGVSRSTVMRTLKAAGYEQRPELALPIGSATRTVRPKSS